MDDEGRVGPLSYSVEAADTGIDPDRPIIVGGITTAALLVVSLVLGWFTYGWVADARLITRGYPLLIVVVALGLTAWTSRGLRRRPRRQAFLVVTGIALLAALLVNRSLGTIKPALPQVRQSIDSAPLPPGFRLLDERTHGDRFCHRGCPTVVRRYAAPVTDPDPVSTFVLALFADGWQPPADVTPSQATIATRDGITVQLGEKQPHVVEVTAQRNS
jgi:hypothetical protein